MQFTEDRIFSALAHVFERLVPRIYGILHVFPISVNLAGEVLRYIDSICFVIKVIMRVGGEVIELIKRGLGPVHAEGFMIEFNPNGIP